MEENRCSDERMDRVERKEREPERKWQEDQKKGKAKEVEEREVGKTEQQGGDVEQGMEATKKK